MAFVPVEGVEETDEEGKSRSNRDEAAKVLSVVNDLLGHGRPSTRGHRGDFTLQRAGAGTGSLV